MNDRNPKGQFLPGNRGRPVGARNKLHAEFIRALEADFKEHGDGVIRIVRTEEPATYLKIIASVLPKEFVFENTMADLGDEQLDELLAALRERMVEARTAALEAPSSETVN